MEGETAGRRAGWRPSLMDVAIALVLAVVQAGGVAFTSHFQPERRDLNALGVALVLAGPVALLVRRRFPVSVFAVTLASTAAYIIADYPRGPVFFGMIVALGTTVLAGRHRAAVGEIAVGYVVFLWGPWVVGAEDPPTFVTAMLLAAWLLVLITGAELLRQRRDRRAAAARAREDEARRQVTEERLRIARELHDVVAHNISLVNLQAGVALHLIDRQPDQARTALAAIKDASKEALVELRSVLGVLRQVDDAAPRAPTPGLGRLPALVDQTRAAGLDVEVHEEGGARPLTAAVDLAAFRIVQEALTNVSRHAGPATAAVRLAWGPDELLIEITDDGRGTGTPATRGTGNGLAGMRERAEAVGGELEAGPRPGFGWRVRARLPFAEPEPEPEREPQPEDASR